MSASVLPPRTVRPRSAREWAVLATLVVVGALTTTPALALLDPAQLAGYGVTDPDIVELTLLQHRGALQLALGAAIVWAAVDRRVRVPVLLAATVTKGTGVALTLTRPEVFAAAPGNVGLYFDLVCLVVLPSVAVRTLAGARRERAR